MLIIERNVSLRLSNENLGLAYPLRQPRSTNYAMHSITNLLTIFPEKNNF